MALNRIEITSQSRTGASRPSGNSAICLDCPAPSSKTSIARRSLAVVDLSKIKHLPLNHAAVMNAPVFHNRPCAMFLAVLAANLGAQKHDADSRLAHGGARDLVGTTSD